MTLFEIIVLAIIQGLTEFLPISSSAHLLLPSIILGWQEQGLAFDVAVHVGSLTAVVIYFRNDLLALAKGWFGQFAGQGTSPESRMAWWLILATMPAIVVGLLAKSFIEEYARSGWVIAFTTIVFGLLLLWADRTAKQNLSMDNLGWRGALTIGLFQILALIPGTSRSGITMTAGLMLGLDRVSAARFSFMLSIPVIIGAGTLLTLDLLASPDLVDWSSLIYGSILSFVSAYACIYFFLSFISKIGMLPFVLYRLFLGILLVILMI